MSTVELKREAKALIDAMSDAQLRAASEFLTFVKARRMNAATLELVATPGFMASFARGVRDVKSGHTREWRKVRSRV